MNKRSPGRGKKADIPQGMVAEEEVKVSQKLCELDGVEEFNCVDCPEFDGCQMILYDSYDESDNDDEGNESGLSII
jgi:hypothetical protein